MFRGKTTRIESIGIKNYRVFRDVVFDALPRMTVVIGANGSGKSTLFDVFCFLKEALRENVAVAVARRGGFRELVSRDAEGPIEFVVKFRDSGGRLVTYQLVIGAEKGRVVVEREALRYRVGRRGWPKDFVSFRNGVGRVITGEGDYGRELGGEKWEHHELNDPSALAIKGLGQFKGFPVVSELVSLIEDWYVSDFHIAEARSSAENWYAEHLSPRGDNVAQVAKYLYENHRSCFERALDAMRRRVPGVSGVEATLGDDGRLVLRFQEDGFREPFVGRYVSDGTIKMFAYLMLLYDPEPHPLLGVEEPENYLYHGLLQELAEEFRAYAQRGGQVFVSTHSTDFLNGVELDEIFWLVKRDGFSMVKRASDSELLRSLVAGSLPGRLWRQNLFEGVGLSCG